MCTSVALWRVPLALLLILSVAHFTLPGPGARADSSSIGISNGAVSPSTVAPPNSAALSATISSPAAMPGSIIDFEVFSAAGTRVYQTYLSGVNLAANSSQTFTATWPVPVNTAVGTYTVNVGVFNQWWSYRYAWASPATSFQVTTSLPTPTSTPVPVSISGVVVTPASIAANSSANLSAKVTTVSAMPGSIIDFEVFNAAGTRIYQTYQTGVNLAAGNTQSFGAIWPVPLAQATGTYTVDVGVFNQWWSYRYAWAAPAASFQVTAALPTNTPLPTATSTPVPVGISGVAVSPSSVPANSNAAMSAKVTTVNAVPGSIIDFEVFNASGARVYQTYQSGVNLAANSAQTFTAAWPVPLSQAAGAYSVDIGVFSQNWASRYAWAAPATSFQVTAALPTNTPLPTATSTQVAVSVSSVAVNPSTVSASSSAALSAKVTTAGAMASSIIDFEVFDASGTRQYQTYQTGVNLAANATQSFSAAWPVPASTAPGTYTLDVGVFNQWWSYRFAWTGASFHVAAPIPTATSTPGPPSAPLALGAWIPGDESDPSVVDSFASMVGVTPKVVSWYQDWEDNPGFQVNAMNAYLSRGEMPIISWLPDGSSATPTFDRAVANGSYDSFINQWAMAAAAWGHPFYLRFAWEMNGYWQPFSPGVSGNTTADYVAMWQHVHDLFVQDGATNARWVWSPNVEYYGSTPFASVYPGDAYVDYIGMSGFNDGHTDQYHWWTSLHDVFAQSYTDLTTMSAKPMIITETASTETGGDKAAWITQGFLTDIPVSFPRVRAVVWFDENKEQDWRVNSSAASLAAYQQVAASPLYQGQLS